MAQNNCLYSVSCGFQAQICEQHQSCPLYLERLEQDKAKGDVVEEIDRNGLVKLILRRFSLKNSRETQ